MSNITDIEHSLGGEITVEYSDKSVTTGKGLFLDGDIIKSLDNTKIFNTSNYISKDPITNLITNPTQRAAVGEAANGGVPLMTEDQYTITSAGLAKASAGRIDLVTCLRGSAITLTLYDDTESAAGRTIWTGTLSAGDSVVPASPLFFNGCYASFSGTASFSIATSEVI